MGNVVYVYGIRRDGSAHAGTGEQAAGAGPGGEFPRERFWNSPPEETRTNEPVGSQCEGSVGGFHRLVSGGILRPARLQLFFYCTVIVDKPIPAYPVKANDAALLRRRGA